MQLDENSIKLNRKKIRWVDSLNHLKCQINSNELTHVTPKTVTFLMYFPYWRIFDTTIYGKRGNSEEAALLAFVIGEKCHLERIWLASHLIIRSVEIDLNLFIWLQLKGYCKKCIAEFAKIVIYDKNVFKKIEKIAIGMVNLLIIPISHD